MAFPDGITWNEAAPTDATVANQIDDYMRDTLIGVRSRMALEHVWPSAHTGTGSGGRHTFITLQAQTAAPTMAGTTAGAIWVKSSGLDVFVTNSAGTDFMLMNSVKGLVVVPAGTGTQGDIIIGSSANGYGVMRLAGSANGQVLHTHAGTAAPSYLPIDLAGTATVLSGQLSGTSMTTILGAWSSATPGDVIQATADGFVCAYSTSGGVNITGLSDGSNPPTTIRGNNTSPGGGYPVDISFPVKKSDYWKVTNCSHAYWIPLGV